MAILWWRLRRLRSKSWEARRDAASSLGDSRDPRAIAALADTLEDEVEEVVEAAAHALLGAEGEGVGAFLTALQTAGKRDGGRRWRRIAALLAAGRDASVVDRIGEAMEGRATALRLEAVRLLGALADPRAIPALTRALGDASAEVVSEGAEALSRLGTAATPALTTALATGNDAARRFAARALGRFPGAVAVDALVLALKDRDAEVRRVAARSLGEHRDPASLDALLVALRDASAAVAQEAATAVGRIGDPRAVDLLIHAAHGQTGAGANLATIQALAALGDPGALDFLLERLNHPDPKLVAAAAAALGSFKDPRAVDALIGTLEHGHEMVRVAAAQGLARIGHPMALTALTLALERAARREGEKKELEEALRKLAPRK